MKIQILQQNFQFHPSGIAFWEEQQLLLIADVHLGKISHFRKHGSAVPQNAVLQNFDKLTEMVKKFQPKNICFLGDLFHSAKNAEWGLFEKWVEEQTAKVSLILGNHDIISPLLFENMGVRVFQELYIGKFKLTHHPEVQEAYFNICGHIHPGYRLTGLAKQHLKLKCFFRSKHQLILPAFGEFTGVFLMKPEPQDQIFVCAGTVVLKAH